MSEALIINPSFFVLKYKDLGAVVSTINLADFGESELKKSWMILSGPKGRY